MAEVLIVHSKVKVTADLMEHACKLRVIGRAGVGVENIGFTQEKTPKRRQLTFTHLTPC